MSVFQQWKLRGPVRTLRTELAEWDITNEQWQAPRRVCLVQLRPDGRVVEQLNKRITIPTARFLDLNIRMTIQVICWKPHFSWMGDRSADAGIATTNWGGLCERFQLMVRG